MACCLRLQSHSISPESPSLEECASSAPLTFRRIRPSRQQSLQSIYNSIPHRFRLQLYNDEIESFRFLADSQEEICRSRTNEMYQLLGMFAVFQGVIFSAVSQSTVLSCRHLWSPVALSFTACVAAVAAVIKKRVSIGDLKEEVRLNNERVEAIYGKIELMKLKGMDFDFNCEPDRGLRGRKKGLLNAISTTGIALVIILVSFTVGIIFACEKVLCRECKCPPSRP